jgi:hypothetical protein
MEALEGKDYADMLAVLGHQDLQETVKEIGATDSATCLHLDLKQTDPDAGMNDIAYEKGYFLLRYIESVVGRDKWDTFLKAYFKKHALTSITTEDFLKTLQQELFPEDPQAIVRLGIKDWIYKPGIPALLKVPHSTRFDAVDRYEITDTNTLETIAWSTHEWLRFLRAQPDDCGLARLTTLDKTFGFTNSTNAEIQAVWFRLAALNGYDPAKANMDEFLVHTGRRKFLTPTYKAIIAGPWGMAVAKEIYQKARPNYHFVATNTLDEVVK